MKWTLVKTSDVVTVDLGEGHTAKLRPLTPRELRAAEMAAGVIDPYAYTCFAKLYELSTNDETKDKQVHEILSKEEREGYAQFQEWLRERVYHMLKKGALVEIDGETITDLDAFLEQIRPVQTALDLIDVLGIHLKELHEIPAEGKELSAPTSGLISTEGAEGGNVNSAI